MNKSQERSVPVLPGREGVRGRLSWPRAAGYALYNVWLLSSFYNSFLYLRTSDFRSALYHTTLISLAVLTVTVVAFPRLVRNADKHALSLRNCAGSGALMAIGTVLTVTADGSTPVGAGLLAASAVLTGVCSGTLFLGWGSMYADVGTRVALLETSGAWAVAGVSCAMLSLAPAPLACLVAVAAAVVNAALLRMSAFRRPARPVPAHAHELRRRTKLLFGRGLLACTGVGVVAGFSDVMAGFRYLPVPEHYEIYLAASCAVVALLILAAGVASKHDFVTYAYRIVTLLLLFGCLLTPFTTRAHAISNVVVFGAYISFTMLLCVVCIEISNYFDQPATHVFGPSFFCLYIGEISGNALGHWLGGVLGHDADTLAVITIALTLGIALANLFLFTEKDLTETSLGEMTDDDAPTTAGGTWLADAASGVSWIATPAATDVTPWTPEVAAEQGAARVAQRERCATCGQAATCSLAPAEVSGRKLAGQRQASMERICALMAERFGLTPRERDVLPLIVQGRTIARIQEELHISQGTVSTHTRHIYQKAGVRNRQGLLDLIEELVAKNAHE